MLHAPSRQLGLATAASLLVLLGGCERPTGGRKRDSRSSARLANDKLFGTDRLVSLWEMPLRQELIFPAGEISGEELPEARRYRRPWVRRSALGGHLLLHPKRLVWVLPGQVTPGGHDDDLHLVLKPSSNLAALVSHRRKVFWADTPAQVAAWMEGAMGPGSMPRRLEVLAQDPDGVKGAEKGAMGSLPRHTFAGLLVSEPAGAGGKPRRTSLAATSSEAVAHGGGGQGQALLWDLALVSFLRVTSSDLLAPLRRRHRWPLTVDLRPADTSSASSPWLRVTFLLQERRRRKVPSRLLCIPPGPGYRRLFGPLTFAKGRQLLHPKPPHPLKRRKGDPRRPTLLVHNHTHRASFVYADGVLLGWVGPAQTFTLRPGEPGYYRVTARSLFGTTHWGPRDLYVPGEIHLRSP